MIAVSVHFSQLREVYKPCLITTSLADTVRNSQMLGDRDSEIALVVEDNEILDSEMCGEYVSTDPFLTI